jgi:hypothetical protein
MSKYFSNKKVYSIGTRTKCTLANAKKLFPLLVAKGQIEINAENKLENVNLE